MSALGEWGRKLREESGGSSLSGLKVGQINVTDFLSNRLSKLWPFYAEHGIYG